MSAVQLKSFGSVPFASIAQQSAQQIGKSVQNIVAPKQNGAKLSDGKVVASPNDKYDFIDALLLVTAGALCRTLGQGTIHPLDTIKTRLQVSLPLPALKEWHNAVEASATVIDIGGLKIRLSNLFFAKGFFDVYLGFTGAVGGTFPTYMLYFAVDEVCKRFFLKNFGWQRRSMQGHFIASTLAATAAAVIKVPTDVLKHRVQAYVYPNVVNAAGCILKQKGLLGMYDGFAATLMRDVPEMVVQFTVYEQVQTILQALEDSKAKKEGRAPVVVVGHPLLVGGIAGAVAAFVTTPCDVLKTQMQCSGAKTLPDALNAVLKDRGIAGLFGGVEPRVVQTTILSAVFFFTLEIAKVELKKMQERRALRDAATPLV
nr:s-adenosylmethionine carrier 1 (SAMC1) [Polytomella parva]|eukprot:CAMPEP_0175054144 /NCGR_PEP_ID=MMETSP0052_2-20121109/9337_1 /TAXON_ID=51329 ORGANISM="Polytomella parva, Strain SAG 63-3" /NCGR_SAMPLE_ID=MMETSP0052_2 /ASSEMBLY_ACC=CAM_ASM_000194 /LENGTH=370 /DNA_ID=CAMNT_0016318797 /DNA_START=72 /DNA_END=1184 /DNA_ORIENTATION=-